MSQAIPTPLPRIRRFENLGFGLFLHYGLYSLLERGEWVMHLEKIARDDYMPLMEQFNAEDFSGRAIARACRDAGMKYATLTSRHHDGFSLYDTHGLSKWDITKTPAGRDLILDFVEGCRAEGIVPMLYHTTLDWSDERFNDDWDGYQQYLRDSVEILCTNYGELGGLWFDGNWSRREADWQQDQLYAVIRKHQPEAIIINNTGIEEQGRAGVQEIDSVTFERGRPQPLDRAGADKYIAGEMCHTHNFVWGWAKNDFNLIGPANAIQELLLARRAGANLLMNIGPLPSGRLPDYEAACIQVIGRWIRLHGGDDSPIYQGRPGIISGEGDDFGLVTEDAVYLFVTGLTPVGDPRVTDVAARGPGARSFSGVPEGFVQAVWMDNSAPANWSEGVLQADNFPYGTNTVFRVAKVTRG